MADPNLPEVQYPAGPAVALAADAAANPPAAVEANPVVQNPPQQAAAAAGQEPGELEKLKEELKTLQQSVHDFTNLSVSGVLKKLLDYATPPPSEFNKYEALNMLETLQNTARDNKHEKQEYYRVAYQTIRGRTDLPSDHFRTLVLSLAGDKDHQKVFDTVAKVSKTYRRARMDSAPYTLRMRSQRDFGQGQPRCFFCHKVGHLWARCLERKNQSMGAPSS